MRLAVPKERMPGESRVALVPETVARLVKAGWKVCVEQGAGEAAGFPDSQYLEAGAEVVGLASLFVDADVVVKVQRPEDTEEAQSMPSGALLVGLLKPLSDPELMLQLAERRVNALAMELIPRITRAQRMDVLSSQATVGGYKAVLLAANAAGRFFPMLMTAAGTIAPAKVLVIGAGVAGLQAIATARRLGAMVEAFDTRPVVKEQVESLGAKFIELEIAHEEAQDAGGYAKELSSDHIKKEQELIHKHASKADVVITTALIPGKKAPLLISAETVKAMKPGSVIVDLAGEAGGNCALSEPGETVVRHDVTILAPLNLTSQMAYHASEMYSKNVLALLDLVAKDGELKLDMSDEIIRGAMVTLDGEVVNEATRALLSEVEA